MSHCSKIKSKGVAWTEKLISRTTERLSIQSALFRGTDVTSLMMNRCILRSSQEFCQSRNITVAANLLLLALLLQYQLMI